MRFAMPTRLCLVMFGILLAQPASAGPRDDVLLAMQRCGVIQDDKVWLDCTYGAQQIMRARLGLQPAPEYQQRLVPPAGAYYTPPVSSLARPQPPQAGTAAAAPMAPRRGSVLQELAGTAPPVTVSNLNTVAYDSQGAFIVTLDNGQVWHQVNIVDGTKVRLRIGAKITVTPSALWSYTLKAGDNPHAYKVERRS